MDTLSSAICIDSQAVAFPISFSTAAPLSGGSDPDRLTWKRPAA